MPTQEQLESRTAALKAAQASQTLEDAGRGTVSQKTLRLYAASRQAQSGLDRDDLKRTEKTLDQTRA